MVRWRKRVIKKRWIFNIKLSFYNKGRIYIKVLSLFSGIGAYERAIENIGIPYNLINYCEIDDIKSKAYSLLHNISEEKNIRDVTNIDISKIEDFDLLVYSPPCQSFSISGKMQGLEDMRGTLFYNALEIIKDKKPKYCIMENVDNLATKFHKDFEDMRNAIKLLGYNNYYKIINAKNFIPQNRNRVYLVNIRKDVDDKTFIFPEGDDTRDWKDVIDLKDTRKLTGRQKKMIAYAKGENIDNPVKLEGKVQFDNAVITLRQSGLRFQNNREYPTITAYYGKGGGNFTITAVNGKIGGITPRNCFKLMGFEFEDSELLTKNGFSVSSQYVMAGDSVCVPVLEEIFKILLKEYLK